MTTPDPAWGRALASHDRFRATIAERRSDLAVTRNPLLALPGAVALQQLTAEQRAPLAIALRSIQADARLRADKCWKTHKAPMAVYWKAVGVYCGHLARVLDARHPATSAIAA